MPDESNEPERRYTFDDLVNLGDALGFDRSIKLNVHSLIHLCFALKEMELVMLGSRNMTLVAASGSKDRVLEYNKYIGERISVFERHVDDLVHELTIALRGEGDDEQGS